MVWQKCHLTVGQEVWISVLIFLHICYYENRFHVFHSYNCKMVSTFHSLSFALHKYVPSYLFLFSFCKNMISIYSVSQVQNLVSNTLYNLCKILLSWNVLAWIGDINTVIKTTWFPQFIRSSIFKTSSRTFVMNCHSFVIRI